MKSPFPLFAMSTLLLAALVVLLPGAVADDHMCGAYPGEECYEDGECWQGGTDEGEGCQWVEDQGWYGCTWLVPVWLPDTLIAGFAVCQGHADVMVQNDVDVY